ncbi:hypothetical protein ACFPAG_03775 [Vogesella sp. GCM10023246]|uniref:Uncharacterized protein n=1 Tax=Vogesella oryzagri TaxID=3160864 RepID=A0ABV1M0H5_9NEIS
MHTTTVLAATDFAFQLAGRNATLEDIFPGFQDSDRIGIVVNQPCGAMGASSLLMAAATHFYAVHRQQLGNEPGKRRIYPDYFIFHVGKCHGNHAQLDVWPPHKEVIVADDAEQILEAINDRGITRLLVEDLPFCSATFLRETLASASRRIRTVLAYSSSGRVRHGDIICTHSLPVEGYIRKMLGDSQALVKLPEKQYSSLLQARENLLADEQVMEQYRRIELSTAFGMLTSNSNPSALTQHYIATSHPDAAIVLNKA